FVETCKLPNESAVECEPASLGFFEIVLREQAIGTLGHIGYFLTLGRTALDHKCAETSRWHERFDALNSGHLFLVGLSCGPSVGEATVKVRRHGIET
ncbi:MAG: hypothetical protein ACJAZD_002949, partial [Ilumatobacter sp.]